MAPNDFPVRGAGDAVLSQNFLSVDGVIQKDRLSQPLTSFDSLIVSASFTEARYRTGPKKVRLETRGNLPAVCTRGMKEGPVRTLFNSYRG